MEALISSIKIIKEEIQTVTDLLYRHKSVLGMEELDNLLSELSIIVIIILQYAQEDKLGFDINRYTGILTDAMNALEKKDYILFADILLYDLKEQVEELELTIKDFAKANG